MNYNKLLNKQIKKYLSEQSIESDEILKFLSVVNDSYNAYERDRELADRAFKISEDEYSEINKKLSVEIEVRNKSVEKLKETIGVITDDNKHSDSDDIFIVSDFLNQQVNKRKDAEKIFTSLISNLQSGILLEDENRKIVYTNQLFCDLFLIPNSPEDLQGQDCEKSAEQSKNLFYHPENFISRINTLFHNKKLVTSETLNLKDGRIFERSYIPIFTDNVFKGQLWTYTDVTIQKKSQDAIVKSEVRNRLILNAALDGIIMLDKQGKINYWNPQAEAIFGWKEKEVINTFLHEIITPELKLKTKNRFDLKTIGSETSLNKIIEINAINKNNDEFPIELSIITISQDQGFFFCLFVRDISERKKAEQTLAASEEKYRNIITNMNLGLLEVDLNENIVFVNQSFCEMSGYNANEIIGKSANQLFLQYSDPNLIENKKNIRKQGISDAYEISTVNKRGEAKWWLISGAPRYNDDGEIVGSIGIHLDITAQKLLEIELKEARELAQSSANAKQSFLANMSHEIRTPLNAILGIGKQLAKSNLNLTQSSYLETINNAGEHLLNILNDILDFSKIEAGKLNIENIGFNFIENIQRTIAVMQYKAQEKGLIIYSDFDKEINPVLIGDPFRLNQIILNLLSNAIKFSEKGKIELSCFVLTSTINSQILQIKVSDQGLGIDEEFINTLFSSFTQEDKSVSRKFGGTGLGMAITKQLIDLMGGNIEVHSKKNQGTTFTIQLPFSKGFQTDLHQKEIIKIDSETLKNKKILLVEDNELNRLVVSTTLLNYDIKISEAVHGKEAIKLLEKEEFDLILMDIQMPELDGLETTKWIREQLKNPIPIIALTANANSTEREKYFNSGMNDYLSKPFEEIDLINKIAKWTQVNTETNDKLYNLNKLIDISRGNKEFIKKMLTLFIDQSKLTINEFEEYSIQKNNTTLSKVAHRIKPSIENLELKNIIEDILLLEKTSTEDIDSELIGKSVLKVINTLKTAIEQLQEELIKFE